MLANSGDPEQTPHSLTSNLGLNCLPMSQKWDTRLIWVNFLSHVIDNGRLVRRYIVFHNLLSLGVFLSTYELD